MPSRRSPLESALRPSPVRSARRKLTGTPAQSRPCRAGFIPGTFPLDGTKEGVMGTRILPGVQVSVPVLAALIVSALTVVPGTAWACSGPPFDVNRADVIAEGWVEHVEIGPAPSGFGSFRPVQVTLRVVRSLKGDAPTPLVFTDRSSYFPDPGGGNSGYWAGSSGACGVLDADPTGQYALIVF